MALRLVKRLLARAAGRPGGPAEAPGGEKGAAFYDALWGDPNRRAGLYHKSHYYFLWAVIADRLRRDGVRRVFEVGSGPGRLAALLLDQGVAEYTGFDLSPAAVEAAARDLPKARFFVGSALDPTVYARVGYDALLCTEVLEHIEADLTVVSLFPPGMRCLGTVPNFPYESHVRHFRDADEVRGRYGRFFDRLDVATFRSPKGTDDKFFLFDGVRNDHRVADGL